MHTFLSIFKRTILIFLSIFIGAQLNGALLNLGSNLIPPPEGFNLNSVEGLKAAAPFLEAKHYLFPFLAHALGTLISALLITRFLKTQQLFYSLAAGILFLMGGVAMVVMLPGTPLWFILLDLIGAYIPMAYLGYNIAAPKKVKSN
jgi:hypothetical protein